MSLITCTDPGILLGGPDLTARKTALTFFVCFFSTQLILSFTVVCQWFISKKTITFQGFRGDSTFSGSGGVQLIPGWVQMLISIETHRTCDFPRG